MLAAEYETRRRRVAASGPRSCSGSTSCEIAVTRRRADPRRGARVLPQRSACRCRRSTACRSRPGPMTWDAVPGQAGHRRAAPSRAWRCASPTTARCSCRGGNVFRGYLDDPDADRRGARRRRLAPHRRHRRVRRRGLPPHRRPQEGAHHHRGRQERVAGEPRGRAQGPTADRPGVRRSATASPSSPRCSCSIPTSRPRGRRGTASTGSTPRRAGGGPRGVGPRSQREVDVANERFSHAEADPARSPCSPRRVAARLRGAHADDEAEAARHRGQVRAPRSRRSRTADESARGPLVGDRARGRDAWPGSRACSSA